MATKETRAWDFVEKYYPNYTSSMLIAYSDDLQKIIDKEEDEGSDAEELLKIYFEGDRERAVPEQNKIMKKIYEEAIEQSLAHNSDYYVIDIDGKIIAIVEIGKEEPIESFMPRVLVAIEEDLMEDEPVKIVRIDKVKDSNYLGIYELSNTYQGEFNLTISATYKI